MSDASSKKDKGDKDKEELKSLSPDPDFNLNDESALFLLEAALDGEGKKASSGKSEKYSDSSDLYHSFGDYELEEQVGGGGMGMVFRARQVSLERIVAVKLITAGGFADKKSRERFKKEAENAAKLQHPNIVKVYEIGEDNGQSFYAMEYIEGPTLASIIQDKPLPWKKACEYLITLAEAVHFAHENGVLHRDLKPQNVMLDSFGNLRITDFGLSGEIDSARGITLTGHVLGTPNYIPLEQALGKKDEIGPRSEVYSLGAILYATLTTRPPYYGENVAEVIDKQRAENVLPLKTLNASVPKDLNTVCLKCLERDPKNRYTTAQEVADELRRVLEDRPILAKEISLLQRSWRWARRNRLASAALVFLILTALVVSSAYVEAEKARRYAEKRQAETEYESYVTKIGLADAKAKEGALEQARELLESTPEHLRNWEWGRVHTVVYPPVRTLIGHEMPISDAKLSADGKFLVTGGRDGSARIWELKNGKQKLMTQEKGVIRAVDFSRDEKRFATGGEEPGVRVWNRERGKKEMTLDTEGSQIHCLAYSPDGQLLAAGGDDGLIRLWGLNNPSKPVVLERGVGDVVALAYSQNGKFLAVGRNNGSCSLFDLEQRKVIKKFSFDGSSIPALTFSLDNKLLAVGSWEGTAYAMRIPDGKRLFTVRHNGPVLSLAFSSDNKKLLTGSVDHTVKITHAENGRLIQTVKPHDDYITSVIVSKDGRSFITTSYDKTIKISPLFLPQKITRLSGHRGEVRMVRFLNDQVRAVTGSADRSVIVWNVKSGRELFRLRGPSEVEAFDITKDDRKLIVAYSDGQIYVWDLKLKKVELHYREHGAKVRSLDLSPDNLQVVSAGQDGTTRLWDLKTGKTISILRNVGLENREGATQVLFSPSGKQISLGNWNGSVLLLNPKTGKEKGRFEGQSRIRSMAYSINGKYLFVGSDDSTVKIYDLKKQTLVTSLKGHFQSVLAICVFPDGKRIATTSSDGTVKVWDIQRRRELLTLRGGSFGIQGIDYSDKLKSLATGNWNRQVLVWQADNWKKIGSVEARTQAENEIVSSLSTRLHAMIGQQAVYNPSGTSELPDRSVLIYLNPRETEELPVVFDLLLTNTFDEALSGSLTLRSDPLGDWGFEEKKYDISILPGESQTLSIPLPVNLTPEEAEELKDEALAIWNISIGKLAVWKNVQMPILVDTWPYEEEVDKVRSEFKLRALQEYAPIRKQAFTVPIERSNPSSVVVHERLEWKIQSSNLWKIEPLTLDLKVNPGESDKKNFTITYLGDAKKLFPVPLLNSKVKVENQTVLEDSISLPINLYAYFARYRPNIIVPFVEKVEEKIKIDGILNEEEWKKTVQIRGLLLEDGKGKSRLKTQLSLLYNPTHLYFAMQMTMGKRKKATILSKKRDYFSHQQDYIEFFIGAPLGSDQFYQFIFGACQKNGEIPQILDAFNRDAKWNSQFQVKGGIEKNGWVLEGKIPWKALKVNEAKEGMKLGLQLARNNVEKPRERSNWVPNFGDPRKPKRWGRLTLGEQPKPKPEKRAPKTQEEQDKSSQQTQSKPQSPSQAKPSPKPAEGSPQSQKEKPKTNS